MLEMERYVSMREKQLTLCISFSQISPVALSCDSELSKYCRLLHEYRNILMLQYAKIFGQFVENIRGKTEDPLVFKGSYLDENQLMRSFQLKRNKTSAANEQFQLYFLHFLRLILLYTLGHFDLAELARKQMSQLQEEDGPLFYKPFLDAYIALNCFAMARRFSSNKNRMKSRGYLKLTSRYVKIIRRMAQQTESPTYQALSVLMQAESLASGNTKNRQRMVEATETYQEAITLLARNQMYLLEASACERLAECLQHTGDDNPGCQQLALKQAWNKFVKVGAVAKLQCMRESIRDGDCKSVELKNSVDTLGTMTTA